ncbi:MULTISPECIES: S8 family serine peptidase [unclassified Leptolyngbya]|uniref:S8 family peptidase n=1 Tax=unclassified Leptolyngbya TaxID=2650499 RepID=UPI001688D54F|nr:MULTISPECIES: S8 family serine peptidase [unclassified Leptolyngbya]MBD1914154.1 S8 family serine peptidase [Leptolyngbya sp. FACHB-8]MBD2157460.1 S8 family serine peptidase [Leptolyngbya sp. FACHB-16]
MTSFPRIPTGPQTTGRYLVLLDDEDIGAGIQALGNNAGVTAFAHSGDFEDHAVIIDEVEESTSVVFDELGVAVVALDSDQVRSLSTVAASPNPPMIMEPERVVYALPDAEQFRPTIPTPPPAVSDSVNVSLDYLRGYRDAIQQLIDHLTNGDVNSSLVGAPPGVGAATDELTWGLMATHVNTSPYSGAGIRVAVLDTGLDLSHPDFAGRKITSKSFVEGEEVQDGNGHGTHCIGTACGSKLPTYPRYGVAYEAEIFAGKVLSDDGGGVDGGILAGINWAVASDCQIISMSLGAPIQPGQNFSRVYEQVGKRSLRRGTLIIAAAGNDSFRQYGLVQPVSHPANCPSIMAVAAVDSRLAIAPFSNGGLNPRGGQVDVAAPGVDIYSSWPMPTRYSIISGTSMATPHVAGVAALYAQATGAQGNELWARLIQGAKRLPGPSRDVGSGLVQAIQQSVG